MSYSQINCWITWTYMKTFEKKLRELLSIAFSVLEHDIKYYQTLYIIWLAWWRFRWVDTCTCIYGKKWFEGKCDSRVMIIVIKKIFKLKSSEFNRHFCEFFLIHTDNIKYLKHASIMSYGKWFKVYNHLQSFFSLRYVFVVKWLITPVETVNWVTV